jgi:hypothetical protein
MNSQQLSKLSVLPLNKTVVFYSPVEGRDVLVRTGTLSEGNSFVHAIFHAYSKDYAQMEKKGRTKLVSKFYSKISDKFISKRWEDASTGVVAQVPFQENISSLLADFYRSLENKECKTKEAKKMCKNLLTDKKDTEAYQILCEIVPLEDIEKKVLPPAYEKCGEQPISKCREIVREELRTLLDNALNKLGKALDKTKGKFLTDKMVALCDAVTENAEQMAYKIFSKGLKDVTISVDPFTIGILAEKFNRDIYFIDSRTRMRVGGFHYEIIGKLLPGNRIQRQFEQDDPLIKRINTFLYRPEVLSEQYPNLVPYLTKEERAKIGLDRSKSESPSKSSAKSHSKSPESSKSSASSASKSSASSRSKSSKSSASSASKSSVSSSSKSSKSSASSASKSHNHKQSKRRSRHRK